MSTTATTHYLESRIAPAFEMIQISDGSFLMGSRDEDAFDREQPVQQVDLSSFFLGKYPVTQRLWYAVMGDNPSYFPGWDRPVETVSWDDCQAFIAKLNQETGGSYRLPNEAEWEYAARSGDPGAPYRYAGSDKLSEVGWYSKNSESETHPIGLKLPNQLGLYDMSDNVFEWCEDDWHDSYKDAPTDGSAWIDRPSRGVLRVQRDAVTTISSSENISANCIIRRRFLTANLRPNLSTNCSTKLGMTACPYVARSCCSTSSLMCRPIRQNTRVIV